MCINARLMPNNKGLNNKELYLSTFCDQLEQSVPLLIPKSLLSLFSSSWKAKHTGTSWVFRSCSTNTWALNMRAWLTFFSFLLFELTLAKKWLSHSCSVSKGYILIEIFSFSLLDQWVLILSFCSFIFCFTLSFKTLIFTCTWVFWFWLDFWSILFLHLCMQT